MGITNKILVSIKQLARTSPLTLKTLSSNKNSMKKETNQLKAKQGCGTAAGAKATLEPEPEIWIPVQHT